MDTKMEFLSRMGLDAYVTVSNVANRTPHSLKKILEKYAEGQKAEGLKEAAESKLFIISTKDTAYYLSLVNQTLHHRQYKVNLQHLRAFFHIENWKKDFEPINDENILAAAESAAYVSKMLHNALGAYEGIESDNLKKSDLKILLHLYSRRTSYVAVDDIILVFSGYMTKRLVMGTCRRLLKNNYIQQSAKDRNAYCISSTGIHKVTDFFKQVFKANSF